MTFENIQESDFPEIARIYESGIATGNATFQTQAPTWAEWNKSHFDFCRFLAKIDEKVVAWAALTPVSSRCVYGGVAEVSVYVSPEVHGKGVGASILAKLVAESEQNQIWTLQSGIFPENKSSVFIHEKCGFRIVGFREKIGKMGDVWRDNLLLERRSLLVGI
jgi:L-amino acid N-acyltransferase YncA